MKELLIVTLLYAVAQSLTWFQMNLQFKYEWLQDKHFLLSLFSVPIGYIFIKATKLCYDIYGEAWVGRMMGFSIGIVIFGLLTASVLGEGINWKTIVSLILGFIIIYIQTKF